MSGVVILSAAAVIATAIGVFLSRRSGSLITNSAPPNGVTSAIEQLRKAGLSSEGPTVIHFTADWCGPCSAVRRVITTTLPDFPNVTHIELDIDEHPQLSQELGIRSLPTTLIFDDAMQQRYRIPGVPTSSTLRDALIPISGHQG